MIRSHLTEFAGLPVLDFPSTGAEAEFMRQAKRAGREDSAAADRAEETARLDSAKQAPATVAWRLRLVADDEEEFGDYFARFVREVDTTAITALVFGDWGLYDGPDPTAETVRDPLIAQADSFGALRSLFIGDIIYEECEISWINQCDMGPLLAAFPHLEELTTRGVGDTYSSDALLAMQIGEHTALRSLTVQSGGLPGRVVREIASAKLPNLERLELWFGVDSYGGDATPDDLAPVLTGEAVPKLTHLGLRNAADTTVWLKALTTAAVLPRLVSVDLSMGTLNGDDVDPLVSALPQLAHLDTLDLHHHYLTEDEVTRVRTAFAAEGVSVDLSDAREPNDPDDPTPYPAVSE